MTTTAIKNSSRTILVLNLTPEAMPKRAVYRRVVTTPTGDQEVRDVRVMHGASLILPVGTTVGGLPNSVRRCSDVIKAVKAKHAELTEEPDPVVETPTDPEPAAPESLPAEPEKVDAPDPEPAEKRAESKRSRGANAG